MSDDTNNEPRIFAISPQLIKGVTSFDVKIDGPSRKAQTFKLDRFIVTPLEAAEIPDPDNDQPTTPYGATR